MISFRERDVWLAIKSTLEATSAFDNVYIAEGESNHKPEDVRSVEIQPHDGTQHDEWDDTNSPLQVEARLQLMFFASDPDALTRDALCERLFNIAQDALNGQSLGGLTLPGLTRFISWRWGPIEPPNRRLTALLKFAYLTDTWAGFDTTE